MNVYVNKVITSYGGGLAVVAANSIKEAHSILLNRYEGDDSWMNEFYAEIYDSNRWEQLDNVYANIDEPCVLKESHYVE